MSARHKLVILEEEISIEKMTPPDWPMNKSVHFTNWWLIWEGPAHCDWLHPWAEEPGGYGKAGEQATRSKAEASLYGPDFSGWYSTSCKVNSFLHELAWVVVFITIGTLRHSDLSNKYQTSFGGAP